MMQPRIVKDGEPRVLEKVGPDGLVKVRVAELVDRQVVVSFGLAPEKLVGVQNPPGPRCRRDVRRSGDANPAGIHVDVHRMTAGREYRHELG